jgi:phosphopantothenoylcysteine decarboxylase/phosphopantothenate--cysteine ligase
MHEAMYENSAVLRNIGFLKGKIEFISPQMIEGKAKAAEPEDVLEYVLKKFGHSPILDGKKILMTAGPTIEYIDPIRVITNQSTGKTGVLLASQLVSAGAKVTFVYGPGSEEPPRGAKIIQVKTVNEMFDAVKKEMKKKFDIVILSAAASDYTTQKTKSKIKSTNRNLVIKLQRAPKIIDHIKKIQPDVFLIGFKAETDISKKSLIESARKKLRESNADMIIANDIGSKYQKDSQYNEILIVDSSEKAVSSGRKKKFEISKFIRKQIENRI